MSGDTIATLPDPSGFSLDPLTGLIRDGARKLIAQAIEAELATLLTAFADDKLEDGRARLVRHGHLPERDVLTGIGPVPVKVPRVRDRKPGDDKITFTPSILPRYLRHRRNRSRNCCPGFTSRACPRAISPRRWRRSAIDGAIGSSPMDDGSERQGPVREDRHPAEGGLVEGL